MTMLPRPSVAMDINSGASICSLSFPAYRQLACAYSFKVCPQLPTIGSQDRALSVSTTERANKTRTTAGSCP